MKSSSFEERLEKAQDAYEAVIQQVAADIRAKYVVPFCDKHDLRFVTGMGSWCFWSRTSPDDDEYSREVDEDFEWTSSYDQRPNGQLVESGEGTRRFRCKRMLSLLNLVPDGSRCRCDLGSWMEPYTPGQEAP